MTKKLLHFPSQDFEADGLLARLYQLELLHTYSLSELRQRDLPEQLMERSFPLYSFTAPPHYFGASIASSALSQYVDLDQGLDQSLAVRDLECITSLGGVCLPRDLLKERIAYLQRTKMVEPLNGEFPLRSFNTLLWDVLQAHFGKPVDYGRKIIPLEKKKRSSPSPELTIDGRPFVEIYREYSPQVKGFMLKKVRNTALSEDLTAEVFLKVVRFSHQYQEGTSFKNWLFTIAKNTFINEYRRKKDIPVEGLEQSQRESLRSYHTPEVDLREKEGQQRVAQFMDKVVPEDFKEVAHLALIDELHYKEIAEQLHIPLGTVMSRLHRARNHLKEHILELEKP